MNIRRAIRRHRRYSGKLHRQRRRFLPIVTYEWDLDADGNFDDATGTTPSRTYDQPFTGLIGLRATNTAGRVSIAYARLAVTGGNGRPRLPPQPALRADAHKRHVANLQRGASDPDSDRVTVRWTLMGGGQGVAPRATASRCGWDVLVVAPDADSDGWQANVDCDDNDPQAGYCPVQVVPPDPANALTVTFHRQRRQLPEWSRRRRLYPALRHHGGERSWRWQDYSSTSLN